MSFPFETRRSTIGGILLLVMATSCVDTGAGGTAEAAGGKRASTGSAAGSAGIAGETATRSSGGNSSAVGPLEPPPAPPTNDVPQPSAAVGSPNLKVLPWAGFAAAVTYTFDDTQPSQTEHWSELKATGVPMTFFCNPSGNWQSGFDASWTAVAAAGSEIGNHTWSHCHPDLVGCTNAVGTAEDEIDKASTYITTHLGVPAVYTFASPFGDAGWNTYAASRFLVGRGVMGGTVPPSGVTDWYNLPVFPVAAGQTDVQFSTAIDNVRTQGRWMIFMFHSILPTTNNWFAGVEMAGITASLAHAQSLGDVWLDTFVEVGAYARAKQMFEALTPISNTWTWTLPAHTPPGKVLRVTVDGGVLSQSGKPLTWDSHGYYEVALDAGSLTWSP